LSPARIDVVLSEPPWVAVVDDDESLRTSLVRLLTAVGIPARGFGSAEEFLRRPDGPDPACAVLDIQLGAGLNGYELKERLESEGSALPIIFMTGQAELPMSMKRDPGALASCLRKPFDRDELIAQVRPLLGELTGTRPEYTIPRAGD
jgi:FixJ family two-component response regulator